MRDKERLLGQAAGAAAATATGGETVERGSTRGPTPGGRGSSGQQGSISQAAGRHQGGGGGGRYGSGGRGHYMNGAGNGMMGGREDGGGGRGANKRSTPKDKASELQDPDYHRGIERWVPSQTCRRRDPERLWGIGNSTLFLCSKGHLWGGWQWSRMRWCPACHGVITGIGLSCRL